MGCYQIIIVNIIKNKVNLNQIIIKINFFNRPNEKDAVDKALQLIDNMNDTGIRFLIIPLYFIAVFLASLLEISNLLKTEYKVSYLNRHLVDFC